MQALDVEAQRSLSYVGHADILVGIPSMNSARTIRNVITESAKGLSEHFGNKRSLILISDGGSTDATLRIALTTQLPNRVKLAACRYEGVSGKGSAVRAIFEAAAYLSVEGLAMVDSDVESVTPSWIELLVRPVLSRVGLVAPRYSRHKYDGTITNQLCYPLTRALYGKRIRQPIGGDFGLSVELAKSLLGSPLWKTPYIPRFGIDIFITSSAIAEGFRVEEASLGTKIHEAKDPALHLASMFREVAGSSLVTMEAYEQFWRKIEGSNPVPLRENKVANIDPKPVSVSLDKLIQDFRKTYSELNGFKSMLSPNLRSELDSQTCVPSNRFGISTDLWAKTVYHISAIFKRSNEPVRNLLLDCLWAVWSGRVAKFVKETASMTNEEAEEKVEEDAAHFERAKSELLKTY